MTKATRASMKLQEQDKHRSSKRRSERLGVRLDSRAPLSRLRKRKSIPLEKERMARRSERGEKHRKCHTLSSLKKIERGSSSLDIRKKKEKEDKSRKRESIENRDNSKSKKQNEEGSGTALKKKRLDARTYRASFKPQAKKVNQSDITEMQRGLDDLSLEGSDTPRNSGLKEAKEGANECSGKKGDEPIGKCLGEGAEKSVERSGPLSRKVPDRALEGDDVACFSRKRKFGTGESSELKSRDISQIPRFTRSSDGSISIQSSPDGSIAKAVDDAVKSGANCLGEQGLQSNINDSGKIEVGSSGRGEVPTPELILSTSSEGRMLAFDGDSETTGKVEDLKRTRNSLVLESDVSVTATEALCTPGTSSEDAISSSPTIGKSHKLSKRCATCFEHQRLDCDSQKREVCSSFARSSDLCRTALSKDAPADVDMLGTFQNDEITQEENLSILKTCGICKLDGELLCCDGKDCRRSYHLSCLDPPLKNAPFGVWYCLHCAKKKIEFGVHSVCKGMESIWDVREVEVHDCFGIQKEKQYLVKYKGLAHVHNRWIPEKKLLQEDASLVSKFNRRHQKEKVIRWKSEWTVPQRLLQKRLLMSQRQADECFGLNSGDFASCHYEWLVKWIGLGYDHATWELENASFLSSPEGKLLIREYGSRREKAKKASDPHREDKVLQERGSSFLKLKKLPSGFLPGVNNDNLNSVNKLLDYWHKHHSVVVIDDQEQIMKVILFILSLQSHVRRPFLIISTSSALPVWENELLHLGSSINFVVYSGKKDVRNCIQTFEFYEEGGSVMFEVLLSSPDAIVEDFEQLECIGWEAIIVDECQQSKVARHLNQIRKLTSEFRLLLHNGSMKDNIPEYLNLLTFLDPVGDGNCSDCLNIDSNDDISALAVLKGRFAKFLAYERKLETSKFVEFWVPVLLSKVQLEQYCATLLSNDISLRSCSKIDPVGALRDILLSLRKCCDHPYLVDASLQNALTKGLPVTEYLEVGVNASGKLHLLDKILSEIKSRGLRVLVLFQLISGSGVSIGDILDDFLRQRFGPDFYERVDVGMQPSKKQAALNMFNDKERGRFVLLIENRACVPSIKLSAVDAIIVFGSDWNPFNELRALQKICIATQELKVFRFYSCFTVEEKVLILAKQEITLESNIRNINRTTSHMLLTWGASYLFNKLDEFHSCTSPSLSSSTSDLSLLDDVVSDLLTQLRQNADTNNTSNCSRILELQQTGATYPKNVSLLGEQEVQLTDEEPPHVFWSNLLDGRYPLWRYLSGSGSSQRARKKVQHFDEMLNVPEARNNEGRRKRKKVANNTVVSVSPKTWIEDKEKLVASEGHAVLADSSKIAQGSSGSSLLCSKESPVFSVQVNKESGATISRLDCQSQFSKRLPVDMDDQHGFCMPSTCDVSRVPGTKMIESDGRRKLFNAQKSLHLLLKPAILKLCETLQLPDDVRLMVEKFLDYIMHNRRVSQEPESILQAFQISLCWMAASFLKYKLDRKKSLVLAKQHLNFTCMEEEVETVYSMLRVLKKRFLDMIDVLQNTTSPDQSTIQRKEDVTEHLMQTRALKSSSLEEGEIRESSESRSFPENGIVKLVPDRTSKSSSSNQQEVEGEMGERSDSRILSHKQDSVDQRQAPSDEAANTGIGGCDEVMTTLSHDNKNASQNIGVLNKLVKLIQKVYAKRRRMILSKQHEEFEVFMNCWLKEKEKLKKALRLESDLISTIHDNPSIKSDKLKKNDEYFAKKMDKLEKHMETIQREIVAKQKDAREQEKRIMAGWLDAAKNGQLPESFSDLPLTESGFKLESMMTSEQNRISEDVMFFSGSPSEPENANATIPEPVELIVCGEMSNEAPEMIPNEVPDAIYTETPSPVIHTIARNALNFESNGVGNAALEGGVDAPVDNINGSFSTSSPSHLHSYGPARISATHDNAVSLLQPLSEEHQLQMSTGEGSEHMLSCGGREQLQVSPSPPVDAMSLQSNDHPSPHSVVLLQLHPLIDVLTGEHDQLDASAAVQSDPEPNQQLQVPSLIDDRVGSNQLVTSASTDYESEPAFQLPLTSDAPPVECTQPVTSSSTDYEPEPTFQLPLTSDAPPVECTQPVTSASTDYEPEPAFQLPLTSDAPPVECTQPVLSATVIEPAHVVQFQLPSSTDVPSIRLDGQPDTSEATTSGTHPVVQLELPPSTIRSSTECNTSTIVFRSEPESGNEGHSSSQPTVVVTQQNIEARPSHILHLNNVVSESVVHLPLPVSRDMPSGGILMGDPGRTGICTQLNNSTPMNTRLPPPRFFDPLKNELTKLRTQEEHLIKMHEDMKTRFSSECEKEIEEVRRKYNNLIQDEEKTFTEAKKMLEVYLRKVQLNMILAEAFKIKWTDAKSGGQPSRPGLSSTTMQQFPMQSLPQSAQRPLRPPSPPVQVVRHSSALFSSNPMTTVIHPSTVIPRINLQIGSQLRAPPPHLHPFRPSMSAPGHSPLLSGIPSQTSLNQFTTAQPLPSQLQRQLPYYPSGAFSGTQSPVTSDAFSAVHNPSALELLMDVGNRSRANLLRPLSEPNLDTWLPSEQTMVGSGRGSISMGNVGPVAAKDVVCLSDDD